MYYKLGQACGTNWGRSFYYKLGQMLLQIGTFQCYKLGQLLLQIGVTITN